MGDERHRFASIVLGLVGVLGRRVLGLLKIAVLILDDLDAASVADRAYKWLLFILFVRAFTRVTFALILSVRVIRGTAGTTHFMILI